MSQKGIREFDAKTLWALHSGTSYHGVSIQPEDNVYEICSQLPQDMLWVVKPDQLIGKRGKHGLLGIGLKREEVAEWIVQHNGQKREINGVHGLLDTFLIEPYVPHDQEFYISFQTTRESDLLSFSFQGGIEVEENRDHIHNFEVPVHEGLSNEQFLELVPLKDEKILIFISQLFEFFRTYGFTYLEVNPFVFDTSGQIICLDMVAKVDTCEERKQRMHRGDISWVRPFGTKNSQFEYEIEKLDAQTGASLKFSTLNPRGCIGLLLGGGGASVLTIDTLANEGFFDQIINYGELSGNPNYRHNKIYTQGLIDMMCENTHPRQWLCLIGGIANFTDIGVLAKAFVDALEERVDDILKNNIHVLIRRGGINEGPGLEMIEVFCTEYAIPCIVRDSNVYITDALREITFS